jgi:capsular polysaccharide biosynthesis protein
VEEQEIDLADYLSVIIKRKRLIFIGTLVCGVLAAAYSLFREQPPQQYEARSSLLIIPPSVKSDLHLSPFSISIYKELAKAQDLEQAIVDSLDLRDRDGERMRLSTFSKSLEADDTFENGSISSPYLHLIVTSSDTLILSPVQVANIWAALFVQENTGLKNREAVGSYETISRQYDIARTNLEKAEDRLHGFSPRHEIFSLKAELGARTAKLQEFQKAFVHNSLELQQQVQKLRDVESRIIAQENGEGVWVGLLRLSGTGGNGRSAFNDDQRKVFEAVIRTRDDYIELQGWIRNFRDANDLDLMAEGLETKRSLLISYETELSKLRVDAGSMDQVLRETKGLNTSGRTPVVESISAQGLRELLLFEMGYNLHKPRKQHVEKEAFDLKIEVDSLEVAHHQKMDEWTRKREEMEAVAARHQSLLVAYNDLRLGADKLRASIGALRPTVSRRAELDRLQDETQALAARIADLELEQSRLTREIATARSTYDKFAGLLENAKIARAGQPSDLKVVARAVEAVPVPSEASRNIVSLALGVGLLVSVFLAFFLEYLEKANIRLKEGGQAIG